MSWHDNIADQRELKLSQLIAYLQGIYKEKGDLTVCRLSHWVGVGAYNLDNISVQHIATDLENPFRKRYALPHERKKYPQEVLNLG